MGHKKGRGGAGRAGVHTGLRGEGLAGGEGEGREDREAQMEGEGGAQQKTGGGGGEGGGVGGAHQIGRRRFIENDTHLGGRTCDSDVQEGEGGGPP